MKGKTCTVPMPASPWDMPNWFNWYWWLPNDQAQINTEEESTQSEEENIDSKENKIFQKENQLIWILLILV